MNKALLGKISISVIAALFALTTVNYAQTDANQTKKVNFRYSQNPKTRAKTEPNAGQKNEITENAASENEENSASETTETKTSIAKKTFEVAKKAAETNASPTEIYRVGNGDVLFISLQNAPKSSTYYTVLNDGTIDYPLAGEMVAVGGMTTDQIEEILKEKIKLFENPQVSVKVREYASRKYSVLGLVERAGEKKMQRDAVPLYVVRAEAIVLPRAAKALIRRADARIETIDLKDENSGNVLIFADDIIEFVAEQPENAASGFYFIGGEIVSGGQKEFHQGLTLTQAILASGGLKKSGVKKVVVRRKNADGLLVPTEFNLKAIKDGKTPDPILMAGDTIEVGM